MRNFVVDNPFWFYRPLNTGEVPPDRVAWLAETFPDLLLKTFGRVIDVPIPDSQIAVHSAVNNSLLVMGGNQSGKSVSSTIETIITMTGFIPFSLEKDYPKKKILAVKGAEGRVICVSDKVLQNVVLRNFRYWVPKEALIKGDWSKSFNKASRCLTLKTVAGHEAYLEFWTYNQKVETHQGAALVMLLFDEIPPYNIFQESQARLLASKDYRIFFAATPTSHDNTWLHSFLLRESEENGSSVGTFKLSTLHNPRTNLKIIEQMVKTANSLDVVRMRLFGDFISFSGGFIYADVFRRSQHVVKPFPLGPGFTVVRGLDPHLAKPTVVLEAAIDRDNCVYICGMYSKKGEIEEIKRDLASRARERDYRLYSAVVDQSANYDSGIWGKNPYVELRRPPDAIPLLALSRKGGGVIEGDIRRIREYFLSGRLFVFDTPELRPLIYALETISRGLDTRSQRADHVYEAQHDAHACLRRGSCPDLAGNRRRDPSPGDERCQLFEAA